MKTIPTEDDWRSEPWDLDIPGAYDRFAGKAIAEAVDLFNDDSLHYQEDLMFMPTACFRYYIHAYIGYLMSKESEHDSDGASCFFGLVEHRHKEITTFDDSEQARMSAVLDHLGVSQEWFDADKSIYGDFQERADESRKLLQ